MTTTQLTLLLELTTRNHLQATHPRLSGFTFPNRDEMPEPGVSIM